MTGPVLSDTDRRSLAQRLKEKVSSFIYEVPYISSEKFAQLRLESTKLFIIDVREKAEIGTSIIEDAVPVSKAKSALREVEGSSIPVDVVCYCTVGLRSGMYARQLQLEGINVYNYSVMEHLWGDGKLISGDGSEWEGSVHAFSCKYEEVMPRSYNFVVFGTVKAVVKSLLYIPSFISALTAWVARPKAGRMRIQLDSEDVTDGE